MSDLARGTREERPVRRRPADRDEQIVRAAARLFHERGYDRVRMADIAAAVGVSTPAIYRHHPTKQVLLERAITTALDQVDGAFGPADGSPPERLRATLVTLAHHALERRDLWTLLQRELRHLADDRQALLAAHYRRIVLRLAERVGATRTDLAPGDAVLLTHAALAALAGVSRLAGPSAGPRAAAVLAAAAQAVTGAALPAARAGAPWPAQPALPLPAGRREQLLAAAVRLFRRHGYLAVGTDDIGAAAGIAGPSVYHHFASKADILAAAIGRMGEWLLLGRTRVLATTGDPATALDRLLADHAEIALVHSDLLGVYLTERHHLPAAEARRADEEVAGHVAAYRGLLLLTRPDLPEPDADLLVHAALGVVDDLARRAGLRARPRLADELVALARAVLHASSPGSSGDPA